jgi:hypothetical protein
MTVESPLAEQQRAVVELYVHSKWMKAKLTLEDEYLFIEYADDKRDQQTPTEQLNNHADISTPQNTPDAIAGQKRLIKIVKPDNAGLGKSDKMSFDLFFFIYISNRNQYKRWQRKSNANINQ